MARRGDNIRKRKDGRWEARYLDKKTEKYHSVYADSYRKVKEKREQLLRQDPVQLQVKDKLLFKDVLSAWQASNYVKLKESSCSRYQNLIDAHILPTLGNIPADRLDANTINHFLAEKTKNGRVDGSGGLSAAYVRSIALIINAAINYGVSEKVCVPMPSPISKPSLHRKELVLLSTAQQRTLENYLLRNIDATKLLVFITLYTGLRIGEVCALCWEDIDLENKVISVKQTVSRIWHYGPEKKHSQLIIGPAKTTAAQRCIPICSKLYCVLKSYPYRCSCGYVLMHEKTNGFVSPRTFEHRYKQILRECDIAPIHYHALRHTFATRCIACGVDIKSLSEILGHSNASVTLNIYVHSSMEQKKIQLEKLVI